MVTLTPSDMAPIEALPRIVMRQMLSLQASKTIISRVEARAAEQGVRITQLSYDDLLECGLSRNKAVAVGAIEALLATIARKNAAVAAIGL